MTLREQIEEDLSIFFDMDEMATEHTITIGQTTKTVSCIVDNDEGQRNSLRSPGSNYDGDMLFFIRSSDAAGIVPEMMIQFDGSPYMIAGVVEEDGMTQITLTAGQGGF